MSARNKYQSRESRTKIREILLREWDPIGVRDVQEAQDEYDGYVGKIYVLLMDECTTSEIMAAYLLELATDLMGLPSEHEFEAASKRTAEILVALRPSFQTH